MNADRQAPRILHVLFVMTLLSLCVGRAPIPVSPLPSDEGEDPPLPRVLVGGCFGVVCPSDPESRNARVPLEQWGLRQVTNASGGPSRPQVEGDLLTWQAGSDSLERFLVRSDILGFNISSGELLLLGVGSAYNQVLHYQSAGRVVFAEEPREGARGGARPSYLVLVDTRDMSRRVLETGMGGEAEPSAFEGSWLLFRNRGGPKPADTNGLWALHVDDGRMMRLYAPVPDEGGREEILWEAAVSGRHAYLGILVLVSDPRQRNFSIVKIDLESGQRSLFFQRDGFQLTSLEASASHLLWGEVAPETEPSVWLSPQSHAAPEQINRPEDRRAIGGSIGQHWITYQIEDFSIVGFNLERRQHVDLLPSSTDTGFGPSSTDGARLLVALYRNSKTLYDDSRSDGYWMPLPP